VLPTKLNSRHSTLEDGTNTPTRNVGAPSTHWRGGSTSSAPLRKASITVNVRNTDERSRKYCYNGKAISITYSVCMSVFLP